MSRLKRRQFLQFAGSTLTALGISQLDLTRQGIRYAKSLAQSTSRKLALLVGINAYPSGIPSLRGCLTDVEMQYELLVHRFGFNPKDILIITDKTDLKPTRQNILEQFQAHAIAQAKPGDVVVFHFSGHGSQVIDPHPIPELIVNGEVVPNTKKLNGTMVPCDRMTDRSDTVQDIMGRSLFLLVHALQTENVTVVLDSCHSGGGTRGDLVFRAIPSRLDSGAALPSQTELEFQQRWMKDLGLSEAQLSAMRRKGIAKGLAIGSAQFDQPATDATFDNGSFYAGAFTYLLTRYLWQAATQESIGTTFVNLARSTNDLASESGFIQVPLIAANPEDNNQKPAYFLTPPHPWAEAVVREVKSDGQIEYWLGGISSLSLEANSQGTVWAAIDTAGREIGEIEQQSRTGLLGYGKLIKGHRGSIQRGVLLREKIRGIPNALKLRVGLDPSLGNQLELARTSLASMEQVEVVPAGAGAEYLLGRMTTSYRQQVQQQKIVEMPPVDSVGLFLPGLRSLPKTFQQAGESVPEAVNRLQGRLKSLLAGKLLKLITGSDVVMGGNATELKVATAIVPKGSAATTTPSQFTVGTDIQVKVRNHENRNLYVAVISISSSGKLTPLFPYWNSAEVEALLAPKQELITPQEGDGYAFTLRGAGALEILVLASAQPIRDALKGLKTIATVTNPGERSPVNLEGDRAFNWVQELLGDLDRNTRGIVTVAPRSDRIVAKSQLAAISTIVNVVAS